MRTLLYGTIMSLLIAGAAAAIDPSVGAGVDTVHRNLQAEAEIRKRYEEFVAAFNAHDARAMAALWLRQGDHYEPDGSFAEGRDAIERMFAQEHESAFRNATISLTIRSVWMATPAVGMVNGTYEVEGVRDRQGNTMAIRRGLLTSVLVKEDGQWWVAASRATIPVPVPWRPAQH